ncbi:MAG: aldo/keto reductase [Clostridia bacterium]
MGWTTVSGKSVPPIGQGTWRMGAAQDRRQDEITALKKGFDLGLVLIDTAEMYADGESECVVGEAIAGMRDSVFITTKVWPANATREGVVTHLQASLKRMGTDFVDLYLQHWPSKTHPLEASMEGLVDVLERGLARYIGVSNFPVDLLAEADRITDHRIFANQVSYSLMAREPEVALVPYAKAHRVTLMAYSPLAGVVDPGLDAARQDALCSVASRHDVSSTAVALAWILRPDAGPMVTIPKASRVDHVIHNAEALRVRLTDEDVELLDRVFPRATRDIELERL